MFRLLSAFATVAAVVSLAMVGYSELGPEAPSGPEPAFVIEPTERDVGRVDVGAARVVTFTVTNPAGRMRRVVGKAEG